MDKEQLRALPTYRRKCRKQSDCDKQLVCMDDPRLGSWRCLASECATSFQCEAGFMCVPFDYPDGPTIGLCLVEGTQGEGERCYEFSLRAEWGCRPGLICRSGYCGRPCGAGSSTCPDGYTCRGRGRRPACVPSCLRSGCPPERRCVQLDGEFSVCATVRGQDCDLQPCAPGQKCQRLLGHRWKSQSVNMRCALPCQNKEGECPAGFTCFAHYCEQLCDEAAPETCGPGKECRRSFNSSRTVSICRFSE